jgi:THO complex subunit 2
MHSQGTPGFHTLGCYDKVPFRSCDMDMMFTFLQLLGDHVKVVLFSCSDMRLEITSVVVLPSGLQNLNL